MFVAGRWNCGKVRLPYLTELAAFVSLLWRKRALSRHEAAEGLNYFKAFKSLVSGQKEKGGCRMGHWVVHKTMMHPT